MVVIIIIMIKLIPALTLQNAGHVPLPALSTLYAFIH